MDPAEAGGPRRWVLFETAPWGHRMRLPGHHLARWLAERGRQVAYVSAPVSPWHFLSRSGRETVRRRWTQEGPAGQWRTPNLFTFIPRTLLPLAAARPFDNNGCWNGAELFSRPRAGAVLREAGFARADVLLVSNFQMPHIVRQVDPAVLVVRLEDNPAAFPGMPKTIAKRWGELAADADLATITEEGLRPIVEEAGARAVELLPNGVDLARFRRPERLPHADFDFPAGPVALYVGALDSWFDEELLARVADLLPDWTFLLVGPPRRPFERLRARRNVVFAGPRPQEQVPPLLWRARAGIIPFRRTRLVETVSPLKLFEYLGAGLPVVSTRWAAMERLAPPAVLASDAEEFAAALSRAEPPPGGVQWAAAHDWGALFEAFEGTVAALWRASKADQAAGVKRSST